MERVCVSDYYISEFDFTVPKGMLVQLVNAMEDEKYFKNPLVMTTYVCKIFSFHFLPSYNLGIQP